MIMCAPLALVLFMHIRGIYGMRFPDCDRGPLLLTKNDVCNPQISPSDRAAALVDSMNITEKLGNLIEASAGSSRLGLPPYNWWNEALHGLGFSDGVSFGVNFSIVTENPVGEFSSATSFATPLLLAAAFDDEMIYHVADTISTEARAFSNDGRGGLDYWTPNVNPYRDPRWGRGSETPGEDPRRIKGYAAHFLRGLAGNHSSTTKKTLTNCKHYAGYDLETWGGYSRYGFKANISMQDLVEYYLPPFQQCARDSKVDSIMCSYNMVNDVPACAHSYLIDRVLRQHWNWTASSQYVVTDCGLLNETVERTSYTSSLAEFSALVFQTGVDLVCAGDSPTGISEAYSKSLLSEDTIDISLRRQYEALVRVGYFGPNSTDPYVSLGWSAVNTPSSQALARKTAAKSMVLLKNDGALPFTFTGNTKVALIGAYANATWEMLGSYFGVPPYYHGPLYAAKQLGLKTFYASGPSTSQNATGNWTVQIEAAKKADVVLYFGGIDVSSASELNDRISVAWPTSQLSLIKEICALGKPCVVVQLGDQLDDTTLLNNRNVSAILWAAYPGQDGGPAIFDVLTGLIPPAGRLPVTQYPSRYVDQIPMTDMSLRPQGDRPGRTYWYYENAVLPFGHGLHYTTFSALIQGHRTSAQRSSAHDDSVHLGSYRINELVDDCGTQFLDLCPLPPVVVSVTNTGSRTSDFVVLGFIATTVGPPPHATKQLGAYTRLMAVMPKETRSATLYFTLGDLARVTERGDRVLYPGVYKVLIDVPTQSTATLELLGTETTLESWPQPV
ncbi:probable exo-1,4-beta-xylosidase bxlB [Aspergillus udagawae]|uniref:xylan 1,4-beta-xylosidase n=1 Tax=Aspergillus udagawae TaxID=91492 RepID=A0A8H3SCC4_9EURO|nr:probable exo-1,4-beta-xylosidase bxlB [Aspergillus udagawae]